MLGSVFLALIEGVGIMLNRVLSAQQQFLPMVEDVPNMQGPIPGFQGYVPIPANSGGPGAELTQAPT